MSAPHHSDKTEQSRLFELLEKQKAGGSSGEFPNGKICEEDEGELAFGIRADMESRTIRMVFGKKVSWLAFDITAASELRDELSRLIVELRTGGH